VAFSGGAQAFSTAVESGQLGNLASGPVSAISQTLYLSPGLGIGGSLAFPDSSSVFHGSGIKDFAATFFARLNGQNGQSVPGCGHSFGCLLNSRSVQAVLNPTPCTRKILPRPDLSQLPVISPTFWQYWHWDPLFLGGSGPSCSQSEVQGCEP
jgi:hypothetical protein